MFDHDRQYAEQGSIPAPRLPSLRGGQNIPRIEINKPHKLTKGYHLKRTVKVLAVNI